MKDQTMITALKGMLIGGTMLVPGVSGGTMAMLLGIYSRLISAVSSFRKDKKGNLLFLLVFALGGILGMLIFARPILFLIEKFPMPMLYFFLGAVAGGIPLIFKEAKLQKITLGAVGYVVLGALIMGVFALIPGESLAVPEGGGAFRLLLLVAAGFLAAIALVLPGLSVSYFLLLLGLYDATMEAIASLRFSFLIPMGVGIILGIILTTKTLERAMEAHPKPTYLIILGFVLASAAEIFPGIPSLGMLPICLVTVVLGFSGVYFLAKITS